MTDPSPRLLERLAAREPAALAEFLELRRHHLSAFIESQLGAALRRKVEVDDVFQETSAEALRVFTSTEFTSHDPYGWLCTIAQRRIVDLHRHFFATQKRDSNREMSLGAGGDQTDQPGFAHLLAVSMTTPSAAFSRNAREAQLADALARLPEDQREALRLRYVENLASKEIADRLGKTDAAVRVMLTRSLKRLQQLLAMP